MADWYARSKARIEAEYGEDARIFTLLLATLSANNSLKSNWTLAVKAYEQLKGNGLEKTGYVHSHYVALSKALEASEPQGRKTKAFFYALLGDPNAVAVDIWMLRWYNEVYTNNYRRVNDKVYDEIERTVKAEAVLFGCTPAQRQAQIWCEMRGDSSSFAEVCTQYRLKAIRVPGRGASRPRRNERPTAGKLKARPAGLASLSPMALHSPEAFKDRPKGLGQNGRHSVPGNPRRKASRPRLVRP